MLSGKEMFNQALEILRYRQGRGDTEVIEWKHEQPKSGTDRRIQ